MGMMTFRPGRRLVIPSPGVQVWTPGVASAPAFTGVLDGISNVAVAYSLRKLRSAYAGSAVRVRRSSDSTEQDIGFASDGEFDSAAFSVFVGGGTGFVKTWYDQSGNGRDATQATTGSQPSLALSGSNSKPYVATSAGLSLAASTVTVAAPWAAIFAANGAQGNDIRMYGGSTRFTWDTPTNTRRIGFVAGGVGTWPSSLVTPNSVWSIVSYVCETSVNAFLNGGTPSTCVGSSNNNLTIGTINANGFVGGFHEIILVSSALLANSHNTIGNNMATRYGLSWVTVT